MFDQRFRILLHPFSRGSAIFEMIVAWQFRKKSSNWSKLKFPVRRVAVLASNWSIRRQFAITNTTLPRSWPECAAYEMCSYNQAFSLDKSSAKNVACSNIFPNKNCSHFSTYFVRVFWGLKIKFSFSFLLSILDFISWRSFRYVT